MAHHYLGIDLGGTNVKAGVVDAGGRLVDHVSLPTARTPRDLTADGVIAQIVRAGTEAISKAGVERASVVAVGLLSPGQADLKNGIVRRAANFPQWRNVPLRDKVSKALGLPAILENDGHAAAFGEWWAGAGAKYHRKSARAR